MFLLITSGEVNTCGFQWTEAKNVARHPDTHKDHLPTTRNHLALNGNRAKIEKYRFHLVFRVNVELLLNTSLPRCSWSYRLGLQNRDRIHH